MYVCRDLPTYLSRDGVFGGGVSKGKHTLGGGIEGLPCPSPSLSYRETLVRIVGWERYLMGRESVQVTAVVLSSACMSAVVAVERPLILSVWHGGGR